MARWLPPEVPPGDRELMELLETVSDRGALHHRLYGEAGDAWGPSREPDAAALESCLLTPTLYELVLPRLAATGRLVLWLRDGDRPDPARKLRWDDGGRWRLELEIAAGDDGEGDEPERLRLRGVLRRGPEDGPEDETEELAITAPRIVMPGGLLVLPDRLSLLERPGDVHWVVLLRRQEVSELELPAGREQEAITALFELPELPPVELPPAIGIRREAIPPLPRGAWCSTGLGRRRGSRPISRWRTTPAPGGRRSS